MKGYCPYRPELGSLLSDRARDGRALHFTLGVDDLIIKWSAYVFPSKQKDPVISFAVCAVERWLRARSPLPITSCSLNCNWNTKNRIV